MSRSENADSMPPSSLPIPIAARPPLRGGSPSSLEHLSSTPFSSSPTSERFEYPFSVAQPQVAAASPTTQALPNGSIVPPSGSGRGTDMTSFASYSPPSAQAALRYPSATASASQAPPERTPPPPSADARPATAAGADGSPRRHSAAAQLCALASAHPRMPPSLALKQVDSMLRGAGPVKQRRSAAVRSNSLSGVGQKA